MTLAQLLQEQKRCSNRLYDEEMQEVYLACQKVINKMAEASTLDVDLMFAELDFAEIGAAKAE